MKHLIGEIIPEHNGAGAKHVTIARIERQASRLPRKKQYILRLAECWLEDGVIDYVDYYTQVEYFSALQEALQYCCAAEREVDYITSNLIAQLMRNHKTELIDGNGNHLEEDADPPFGRMLFRRQDAPGHVHWVQVAPEVPPEGPGFGIWVELTDGSTATIDATIEVEDPEPEPATTPEPEPEPEPE